MIKITVVIMFLTFVFGSVDVDFPVADNMYKFEVSALSVDGQKAYKNLLEATRFESGHLGRGGGLSQYVKDFNIIRSEKNADSAFKSLQKNGTLSAQLYGLSGIYFTDFEYFQTEVKRYRSNNKKVQTINGCIVGELEISEIVYSTREKVAVVKPDQTTAEFFEILEKKYNIDIANGGYSATFKSFAKR